MATTQARQVLRSKFVRNAIPTEQDFKDLIDAQLNQKDDGIFRNPGEPLSIVAGTDPQKRALRLYGDDTGAAPDWLISLNPGQDPSSPATNRRGFGIANSDGTTRLFIHVSGNVGIGTTTPDDRLDVDGRVRAGALSMGPWPANPANYAFIGSNLQDQTKDGNYALLVGTGAEVGATYLNASRLIGLRIRNVQHMTFAENGLDVNVPIKVASDLSVSGKISAAGSDLYFTKTDHNHTGIGNTSGFAAIENAANFNGLMILGRAQSPHPIKPGVSLRVVRLWDFLDVQGEMRVTGPFLEISGAGNERCYIGGDGGGNDVQVGSLSSGVQNLSAWNATTGRYMTFFCQNLVQASDLTLKSNVSPLTGALEKVCALRGVRFDWRDDGIEESQLEISSAQQIGLIAQEVEQVLPEVVTDNRGSLGISYAALIPLLIEAVKELQNRITRLESSALPGQGRSQAHQN
jgi:hypothetical protein